ncbi:MAG: tetraacyldisaccharide 4'-kinase, partial [Planctomycetota bacterium]
MKTTSIVRPAWRWLLAPMSWPYAAAMRRRNARYDRDASASYSAGVPVVSVGNITVGGSGKTPMVVEIVRELLARGLRPAILTRGYGAAAGRTPDEVEEFHDALPDVPVVVNADRVAGARTARDAHGANCLVLDDGFQHRRLRRDLDMVLIDALAPWGGGLTLPAGRLREPLDGLRRADLIVVTRRNQVDSNHLRRIEDELSAMDVAAPVVSADVHAECVAFEDGTRCDPHELSYSSVMPVCGIGNPATFLRLAEELAGRMCAGVLFRDHHNYRPRDVAHLLRAARRCGADIVLTTRKDWSKLAELWRATDRPDDVRLARLEVRLCQGTPTFCSNTANFTTLLGTVNP